jgi:hypothetical protein
MGVSTVGCQTLQRRLIGGRFTPGSTVEQLEVERSHEMGER